MTLKEKLSPVSESYSSEEISEDLNIPIEMIHKMEKVGIITPVRHSDDQYSFKTVQLIERYWNANASKMLNAR